MQFAAFFSHFGAIFDWTRGKFGFLRNSFPGFFPPRSHAVKFCVVRVFLRLCLKSLRAQRTNKVYCDVVYANMLLIMTPVNQKFS